MSAIVPVTPADALVKRVPSDVQLTAAGVPPDIGGVGVGAVGGVGATELSLQAARDTNTKTGTHRM